MAFNFKWSPLATDTSFYKRAQELLTNALNKTPKPPIIVDDIAVNEMNLGDIPPDLEVLEIGDLDMDRFKGMFKMCYTGNAFLTLKTKVQANPLNTYLSTRPAFTSPKPLAAASGLTIPIQITLSEIKLSAFIILVYSSQKGVTLVFRNDPLESLRVSSTFDAIPFVRDYLQKEIEKQLRTLIMDELPLIIHRLSLRLFSKEYQIRDDEHRVEHRAEEKPVDPFASPAQDPVDSFGNAIDMSQISPLSLDAGSEPQPIFSQRNLLRLATLTQSHRTLSLFTLPLQDVVFRASAGSMERGELGRHGSKTTPALSRSHSYATKLGSRYDSSELASESHPGSDQSHELGSAASSTGLSRSSRAGGRKRKHRVVDLRKKAAGAADDSRSVSEESTTTSNEDSEGVASALSRLPLRPRTPDPIEPGDTDFGQTPPRKRDALRSASPHRRPLFPDPDETPRQSQYLSKTPEALTMSQPRSGRRSEARNSGPSRQSPYTEAYPSGSSKAAEPLRQLDPTPFTESVPMQGSLDQSAWMNRVADEILRKVHEQKARDARFWDRRSSDSSNFEDPPPAYGI